MVGLGGRILGIVAASSTRGGSGKGQPIVVPLSSGLLDEIIDRTKNRSSVLQVAPNTPIAGREVSFTLKAQPGQIVQIEHLNPSGKEVAWVFPNGSTRSEDDEHITVKNRGADESGTVSWTRPGTLDLAGRWTVRVVFDPFTETPDAVDFPYTMYELDIENQGSVHVGVEFKRIDGQPPKVHYSESVPAAFADDIRSAFSDVAKSLIERWGLQLDTIPDVYLVGRQADYEQVKHFINADVGSGTGFHRPPCSNCLQNWPGIYAGRNQFGRSKLDSWNGLYKFLIHEYGHELFHAVFEGDSPQPAWLNEGLAEWSEFETGPDYETATYINRDQNARVDLARAAAHSGALFGLSELERRKDWNHREGDKRSLQYAQSYMAVRYLIETFGFPEVIDFARHIGSFATLGAAIQQKFAMSYPELESRLVAWLRTELPSTAHYEQGEVDFDAGKYEKAILEYSSAIELNQYRDRYFRGRGWAYYRLDQFEDALRDADLALGLDRFDPFSHNLRAWALYELGDYKRAISDFSRAIESNPHAYYFRGRGMAHDQLAQHGPAIANFDAAIRIDKNYAQAYLSRGWAYFDLERYQESLLDGSRVIELEPENRWGYRMRGRSLYRLGRYEEAILDFDRALKVDPHQWVYVDRGRTNYKLSRYDQALLDFDAAIRIDPEYAHAYDWRAATHDKLGNEPEKKADRQIACSIDNTFWFC